MTLFQQVSFDWCRAHLQDAKWAIEHGFNGDALASLSQALSEANKTRCPSRKHILAAISYTRRLPSYRHGQP